MIEITVLDEDANGPDDFLGKLAVPLINVRFCVTIAYSNFFNWLVFFFQIKNKEKRWYALKDKKLRHRVKGQILLEFELYYNPVS